ncbi:MAG: hypothetical protein ACXWZ3_11840 [Solirubrobacterales bacterium]
MFASTAAASKGDPSWKRTPGRKVTRQAVRPAAGLTASARPADAPPAPYGGRSRETSGSWTWRLTSCAERVVAASGSRVGGSAGSA